MTGDGVGELGFLRFPRGRPNQNHPFRGIRPQQTLSLADCHDHPRPQTHQHLGHLPFAWRVEEKSVVMENGQAMAVRGSAKVVVTLSAANTKPTTASHALLATAALKKILSA